MLCSDANLLVHAYLDNELDAGDSVQLSRHLAACPDCAATLERHGQLRDVVRRVAPHYQLPEATRARVLAALPSSMAATAMPKRQPMRALGALPMALAASLLLVAGGGLGVAWQRQAADSQALAREVLSDHLRSLQAEHLTDVATSDRHTVKPWFDGKLDYSPQVRDLGANGFVLVGGRLDVVQGRRVAAIVYRRRLHAINLFQWPVTRSDAAPSAVAAADGFTAVDWTQDGMHYWAVSNLGRADMDEFVAAFRAAPPLVVPPTR